MQTGLLPRLGMILLLFGEQSLSHARSMDGPVPRSSAHRPISPGIPARLDSLEPRTPIRGADLPLIIEKPGPYYLTENILSQSAAILIKVSHVSIDLMGFTLSVPESSQAAIAAEALLSDIAVRNGTLIGGEYGLRMDIVRNVVISSVVVRDAGTGIVVGDFGIILNSTVTSCDSVGIRMGSSALVRDSSALFNRQGIQVGSNSSIIGMLVSGNDGIGLEVGDGSLVQSSVISGNEIGLAGGDSVSVLDLVVENSRQLGIQVGAGSEVKGCSLHGNKGGIFAGRGAAVLHCSVSDDQATGVFLHGPGGSVRDSTLENVRTGIRVGDAALVVNNSCREAFLCIQVFGSDNRMEDNHIVTFDRAIEINGSSNVVSHNTLKAPNVGVRITGSGNFITSNTITLSSCGLRFVADSGNGYKDNTFLSVPTAVCGPTNVNVGGNISLP